MPQIRVNGKSLDLAGIMPVQGVVALTASDDPGDNVEPGRWLRVVCTNAGNVSVVLADDSEDILPVTTGLTYLPLAVKRVNTTGTTATATFANWL